MRAVIALLLVLVVSFVLAKDISEPTRDLAPLNRFKRHHHYRAFEPVLTEEEEKKLDEVIEKCFVPVVHTTCPNEPKLIASYKARMELFKAETEGAQGVAFIEEENPAAANVWPGKEVFWTYAAADFTSGTRNFKAADDRVKKAWSLAVAHYGKHLGTCIKFTKKALDEVIGDPPGTKVIVTHGGGGCFTLGLGPQKVDVGGKKFTIVNLDPGCEASQTVHEIGHLLGLEHTMKRSDHKDYIELDINKVEASWRSQFVQSTNPVHGAFDFASTMFYPGCHPSITVTAGDCYMKSKVEVKTDNDNAGKFGMGHGVSNSRHGLSKGDLDVLRKVYSCSLPDKPSGCNCPAATAYASALSSGKTCQTALSTLSDPCKDWCQTQNEFKDSKCFWAAKNLNVLVIEDSPVL